MTDQSGFYTFSNMPFGGQYIVNPVKDDNHLQGITTLDLVMMQRHILAKELLDSPFKILAADVNQNGKVSSSDMIEIKRMILGQNERFLNSDSWRFVSEDHVFFDLENPNWATVKDEFIIDLFENNVTVDFTGVKLGDVNGDALKSFETRTGKMNLLQTDALQVEVNQEYRIPIRISTYMQNLHGFQLALEHPELDIIRIESGELKIDEQSYVFDNDNNNTLISWTIDEAVHLKSNTTLFWIIIKPRKSISLSNVLKLSASSINSEFYHGHALSITEPVLEFIHSIVPFAMEQNEPNPWKDKTFVEFNIRKEGDVGLKIWDLNGTLQYDEKRKYGAGAHKWSINRQDLQSTGVFIIEMTHAGHTQRKKMLLIQ